MDSNIKSVFTWTTFPQGSKVCALHMPCTSQSILLIWVSILKLRIPTLQYASHSMDKRSRDYYPHCNSLLPQKVCWNDYWLLLVGFDLIFLRAHMKRQVPDVDYNICRTKISNHCALFVPSPPWMHNSEADLWALAAVILAAWRTNLAKIYLEVQHLIK